MPLTGLALTRVAQGLTMGWYGTATWSRGSGQESVLLWLDERKLQGLSYSTIRCDRAVAWQGETRRLTYHKDKRNVDGKDGLVQRYGDKTNFFFICVPARDCYALLQATIGDKQFDCLGNVEL